MKKVKILLTAFVLLGLLLVAFAAGSNFINKEYVSVEDGEKMKNGVKTHGRLEVLNGELCDESGNPIQLKGFSTHGVEWYPRYTNSNALKTTKEYGANVVRLAIYSEKSNDNENYWEDMFNYAYLTIENALREDMYIIVDWHVLGEENPLIYDYEAELFLGEISKHYGDNPAIIYEICNEPNGNTTWEHITEYANKIIPVIRENAPNSLVIVGTPVYSSQVGEVVEAPLEYENIMYALHVYIDVTEKNEYNSYYVQKVLDAKIPLFVSEWGVSDEKNEGSEVYEDTAKDFVEFMNDYNLSWCYWSLCNKEEFHSVIRPDCDKYSGWTEEDFTFSGKIAIDAMKE